MSARVICDVCPYRKRFRVRYKFGTLLLDLFLAMLTGGFWLIWPAYKLLNHGHR